MQRKRKQQRQRKPIGNANKQLNRRRLKSRTFGTGSAGCWNRADRLGGQFATALRALDNKLTAKTRERERERDTTCRKMEAKLVAEKMYDIVGRPEKLEMRPAAQTTNESGSNHNGWRRLHIIIGSWDKGRTRAQMVAQATELLKTFESRDRLLTPYSLRPFASIVKTKCMENKPTETAWQLQKLMECGSAPPKCATVEQSAAAGAQRRAVRDALDAARKAAGEKAIIDSTGTVGCGGKEAGRWNTRTRTWEKRRAWTAMAADIQMDFDGWLGHCAAAQM